MEDSTLSLGLGRTRSATAANVRVWSAGAPHSHSRARTAGYAPRSGTRIVANTDQVYALKQFLERTGPDATTKEIEGIAAATGLDGKWVRQWIRRQVNSNRGKSKKGKKRAGSPTGETSSPSQMSPSSESSFTPLLPPNATGLEVATPGPDARKHAFDGLEGFEAGSKTGQHSGQSATGSYSGIVSLSSSAAAYDWTKSPLPREYPHLQGHPSLMHTADPGASFTVPFRSEAAYQHTPGVSSPDFHTNTTQWSTYQTAHPRSIREAELFASAVRTTPQYGGSDSSGLHISPGVSATTVFHSTALRPALQNPKVPDCLMAGSAYLYRLFHERLADAPPPMAPPETPQLNGGMYMAGLTRPSFETEARVAPVSSATPLSTSVPMVSHVLGYTAYPVAYSMSFRDLIHLTKTVRGSADKDPGPSANPTAPRKTAPKPDRHEILGVQNEYTVPSTSNVDPSQSDFLRVVIRAASLDATREEGETEDEHEAVTPCEGADLAVRSYEGKGKRKEQEKLTDAQVVIVEVDRT